MELEVLLFSLLAVTFVIAWTILGLWDTNRIDRPVAQPTTAEPQPDRELAHAEARRAAVERA